MSALYPLLHTRPVTRTHQITKHLPNSDKFIYRFRPEETGGIATFERNQNKAGP